MLISDDADFIKHARKLVTPAHDPAPITSIPVQAYNYRMNNVLAGHRPGATPGLGR